MDVFNWWCRKRAISGFDFSCWWQNDAATRSQQLVTSASAEREAGNVFPQKGLTDVTPARCVGRDIEHQSCAHSPVVGFAINRWAVLGELPSLWAEIVGKWLGECVCQLAHKCRNTEGRQGWEGASRLWKGTGAASRFALPTAEYLPFTHQRWKQGGQKRNGEKWRASWSGGTI